MANVTATPETRKTSTDLSAASNCYLFVEPTGTTADTVNVTNTAGEYAYGILEFGKANLTGSVWPLSRGGTAKVKLGATLAAGAEVAAGADGRAIAVTTGYRVCGKLLYGGVANDIVEIDIYQGRIA